MSTCVSAQLQVENDFFPVSFIVLEDQEMDVLFGLDMLRRHHVSVTKLSNEADGFINFTLSS